MKNFSAILIFVFATTCILSSCKGDSFARSEAEVLSFSTDTLAFDTVFSTIGSATKKIVVYNHLKQNLHFSRIALDGGANSQFRLNVDGETSRDNHFSNVEIAPRDSMFIFVEVTVNPQDSDAPVLVTDSIVFETSAKSKRVVLEAFGQDVVLFNKKIIYNDTVLNADKPYLIYGYLALNYYKTLIVEAGAKLYFHNNANLLIYGNLVINGTYEKPVFLRGDRLDAINYITPVPYNYVAGQWGGVYLLWNGGNHLITNAIINSAYVGIYTDNDSRTELPNIIIRNSRLHNFVYYGIAAQNANFDVANTEISNTGSYAVYLSGGHHRFVHTTVANFYSRSAAAPNKREDVPSVMIMGLDKIAPMSTEFINCIITGTAQTEFSIADRHLADYNGRFANSYIMRKSSDFKQYTDIVWGKTSDAVFANTELNFKDKKYFDFTLDSVSPARNIADPAVSVQFPLDLNGNSRLKDGKPDAGAYEWKRE